MRNTDTANKFTLAIKKQRKRSFDTDPEAMKNPVGIFKSYKKTQTRTLANLMMLKTLPRDFKGLSRNEKEKMKNSYYRKLVNFNINKGNLREMLV